MAVLHVYKPLGWTPLQAMERLRVLRPEYAHSVMTYAGRLDPMAEGVLVLLTDEDRYRREAYLGLRKVYRATMLFGYASDTFDALGVAMRGGGVEKGDVCRAIAQLPGVHTLALPPYSGYVIKGKPLHWWARNNRLHEVMIPRNTVEVVRVEDVAVFEQPAKDVFARIEQAIGCVQGDFRQAECLAQWRELLAGGDVCLAVFTAEVTSGTYIRSLAQEMGAILGCGGLLLHLQRLSVGAYEASDAVALA